MRSLNQIKLGQSTVSVRTRIFTLLSFMLLFIIAPAVIIYFGLGLAKQDHIVTIPDNEELNLNNLRLHPKKIERKKNELFAVPQMIFPGAAQINSPNIILEHQNPKDDAPKNVTQKAIEKNSYSYYTYTKESSKFVRDKKDKTPLYKPKYPMHPVFKSCKLENFAWSNETKLGRGGFGEVWKAVHIPTGIMVALKRTSAKSIKASPKHVEFEETIQRSLNHPHIAKHYCTMIDERDNVWFAIEYIPSKNLAKLMDSKKLMPRTLVQKVLAQMISALEYIHDNCIVYRDLKAENVLLDQEGNVKLIDFGLSVWDCEDKLRNVAGTLEYTAPEMASRLPHGRAVDWYSLGILLYTLKTGKLPFRRRELNLSRKGMLKHISKGLNIKSTGDSIVDDLILKFTAKKPEDRWGPSEKSRQLMRQHEFFSGFDWRTLDHKSCLSSLPGNVLRESAEERQARIKRGIEEKVKV